MQEIVGKLNHVMEVVRIREATGWPLLMADENWKYISMGDARVCPVCREFEAQGDFIGSEIPRVFPFYEFIEDTIIKPHVHRMYPWLRGECRCHLEWPDAADVLERRLHEEKQLSVGIPAYGKVV